MVPGLAVFPQTTLHILASEASKTDTLYRLHHHPPLVAYGGAAVRLLAVGLILPALAVIN